MFAVKEKIILFGVFAVIISAKRVIRSPDKMEVNIPNYSYERNSGEYQEDMKEEAAYWQGQGDKVGDKEEEGHHQLEQERDRNQDNYDHEKDYYAEQQHNYNKDMNDTYQEDRDKAQDRHYTNQEHYAQNHNDTDFDFPTQGNKTAEDLTATETGERYEEKGTEHKEEAQDKIENYDLNEESPSITYTRT